MTQNLDERQRLNLIRAMGQLPEHTTDWVYLLGLSARRLYYKE